MKAMLLLLTALVLLAGFSVSSETQTPGASALRSLLQNHRSTNCGIDKLDDEELTNFVTLLGTRREFSFLNESARQYMRRQGWTPIEVIGYQPDTTIAAMSDDVLMLVVREGRLYAMEPPMGEDAWMTGLYWSKDTFISTWEVISPTGEVEHCGISELE
ncbi:MAG: hypothetical protein NDJ18_00780 [candidate division Zixibacteria bacterium]|nr:hypothetical protein [candidate division Zixibacteria bacterium]